MGIPVNVAPPLPLSWTVQRKTRVPCRPARRAAGFTLIELFVVLAVLAIAVALGIPAIHNLIIRSKTEGFAREASVVMQRTRLEAIKMSREGVVHLDPAERRLVAFLDADRDGTFNPDPSAPYRSADYVLGSLDLPANVDFKDENGNTGRNSVVGLTQVEVNTQDQPAAVFQPDGSVAAVGAFRIGDVRGNVLEVRVDPAATGRVGVLKWQNGKWLATVDPSDENYEPWEWK